MIATPDTILHRVSQITGVPVAAITGKRRSRNVVYARFLAIAALRKAFPWWSFTDLAAAANRTPAIGRNSLDRCRELIAAEPEFARMSVLILAGIQPAADIAATRPSSACLTRRQFSSPSLTLHFPGDLGIPARSSSSLV